MVLRAWKYAVAGPADFSVPVYFLDTDLPENSEWDRTLTHNLYGGDRITGCARKSFSASAACACCAPSVLTRSERYHMNEGHSSLLALELLDEECACRQAGDHSTTIRSGTRKMRLHDAYAGARGTRSVSDGAGYIAFSADTKSTR